MKKKRRKKTYPANRKKKRPHAQYHNFYRVIDKWGIVPELHHMFLIDDMFYACKPDSLFDDNIIVGNTFFRPIHAAPDFDGQDGDVVYGYVSIINASNMGTTLTRFVYMKDPVLELGLALSRFLGIKGKISQKKHIKNFIWA